MSVPATGSPRGAGSNRPAPSRVNGHLEVTLYGCCELWPHPMVLARSRTATEVSAQLYEVCVR